MPPKHKLHKTTGKLKTLPKLPVPEPSMSTATPDLNSEAAQQFEVELCWCVHQLQNGLKNGKLKQQQVQDHTKALNTLMSNTAPMIKKRQVMRLSFGDYRSLMAAEDKKFKSVNMKIKVNPVSPNKNSVFVKKSVFAQSTGNGFKFNFPADNISEEISNMNIDSDIAKSRNIDSIKPQQFQLVPSNNSFKFNFTNDSVDSQL